MLPSDLLVARRYRDTIRPTYAKLTDENLGSARRLHGLFEAHLGRRRRELEGAIRELEEESGRGYRYVRGLATLLERRCQFRVEAAVAPDEVRQRIFHAAAHDGIPTTLEERRRFLRSLNLQVPYSWTLLAPFPTSLVRSILTASRALRRPWLLVCRV